MSPKLSLTRARSRRPRTAAALAAGALALAGLAVTPSAAAAGLIATKYGYYTYAFGSVATANQVGLSSDPTAYAYLGCTRMVGHVDSNRVAAVDAPSNMPMVSLGAITSKTETFKRGKEVGSRAFSTVASVTLGDPTGVHLTLRGLTAKAETYIDAQGRFQARHSATLADLVANTGTPLDQLNPITSGLFGELAEVITAGPDDSLIIPGLARLTLGRSTNTETADTAISDAIALRITLFGADGQEFTEDDVDVVVGRAHARAFKQRVDGIMGGAGYAADVAVLEDTEVPETPEAPETPTENPSDTLGSLLRVGPFGRQPLTCLGTNGVVEKAYTAGVDLAGLGLLTLEGAGGQAYGAGGPGGSIKAFTKGHVARVQIGEGATSLEIEGIVGRAAMTKTRDDRLLKSSEGTRVASIRVGAQEFPVPARGDVLEIPGLARIRFGVVESTSKRSLKVTALRVVLVPAAAADTGVAVVNLGVAVTRIGR